MTQKMNKFNSLKKTTKVDFATYLGVIVVFIITTILQNNGSLKRSAIGLLVPICCYMSMAVSLNLTVGILGELSLGHAGFMSVGAFSGIVVSQSLAGLIPNGPVRLALSMFIGALLAALVGLLIGTPVLRLQGDYLAIVTLAFGEIIKELINCLIIGCDEKGLHFVFNLSGNKTVDDLGLSANGTAIIKGAQGATGTATIATFTAGFILVMITLIVVLNLTVGILGELSLGHAGFMSVGAFSGIVASQSLMGAIPNAPVRLAISMVVGAIFAAIVGLLIGTPVLRLQGDYLAIVTLAFGEIIKELINCLIIGYDENGLHFIFNPAGNKTVDDLGLSASGTAIIKGAQGATGTATIATFTAGFILVMITLIVVLNLTRSRAGRAIMAIRDNRIAAQAIGLNLTKYKLMAFVTSAALAGAAGALYGLNYSSLQATKFNFNLSILVLVFVVLGGLGNIWGSLIAAAALTILPEALRQFADFRMLIYAIVLIFVMLATNNPQAKAFFQKLLPHRRASAEKED